MIKPINTVINKQPLNLTFQSNSKVHIPAHVKTFVQQHKKLNHLQIIVLPEIKTSQQTPNITTEQRLLRDHLSRYTTKNSISIEQLLSSPNLLEEAAKGCNTTAQQLSSLIECLKSIKNYNMTVKQSYLDTFGKVAEEHNITIGQLFNDIESVGKELHKLIKQELTAAESQSKAVRQQAGLLRMIAGKGQRSSFAHTHRTQKASNISSSDKSKDLQVALVLAQHSKSLETIKSLKN